MSEVEEVLEELDELGSAEERLLLRLIEDADKDMNFARRQAIKTGKLALFGVTYRWNAEEQKFDKTMVHMHPDLNKDQQADAIRQVAQKELPQGVLTCFIGWYLEGSVSAEEEAALHAHGIANHPARKEGLFGMLDTTQGALMMVMPIVRKAKKKWKIKFIRSGEWTPTRTEGRFAGVLSNLKDAS